MTLSNLKEKFICNLNALDQTVICGQVISITELGFWKLLSQIPEIIGADTAENFFRLNDIYGFVDAELGWTLMGQIPNYSE